MVARGTGKQPTFDVNSSPPDDPFELMDQAKRRALVPRRVQYVYFFALATAVVVIILAAVCSRVRGADTGL
jgi:hypothetical protein